MTTWVSSVASEADIDIQAWITARYPVCILLQTGSELMSLAHVATKDHAGAQDLGHYLWQGWYLRAMPLMRPYRPEWYVLPGHPMGRDVARAMFESVS